MNNNVYFMNDAEFDPVAMLTFGVSAKDTDDAIGFFGTGFKYAVAIILRLGGKIKVTSHGKEYVFETNRENIRGNDFDVVYMNGQNAGFTTRLGINWLPWMAFRELFSNCLDEGGETSIDKLDKDTIIEVNCHEIADAYLNKERYFVLDNPIHTGKYIDIHSGPAEYVYYRGVAVYSVECSHVFNIKTHLDLTEERVAKHTFQWERSIVREIQSLENELLIKDLLTSDYKTDRQLGYDADYPMSNEFISTAKMLLRTDHGISENARRAIKKVDEEAGNFPPLDLIQTQKIMMDRSERFLKKINVDVHEYPVRIVKGLGDGVMGRAINGVIYLSELPFHMGTKQVASTLLEEWVHCKYGCEDFDRDMQNWLFDKVLSIGEELRGEPL